jgi:membrane protein DedA with SNARE-associated domain
MRWDSAAGRATWHGRTHVMMELLTHWLTHYGALGLFCLMALGVLGAPIPEETTLTFAGVLVHRGILEPVPAILAATLGCVCGISVSYGLGRTLGLRLVKRYGRLLRITPEKMDKAHAGFERAGHWGLLFGYFLPGIRHLTAIAAGTTKLAFADFALFAYAGALVWSFSFVSLGIFLGSRWMKVSEEIHHNLAVFSIAVVACLIAAALVRWLVTRQKKPA